MHLVFQGFSWLHLSLADFCSLAGRKPFKARELSLLCWRNFSQLLSLWSHSICQLPPLVCAAQNKQHAKIITQPIRILCLVSQPMPKEHTLAWKHLDLDQAAGREVNFVQWLGDADTRKWCKLMGLKGLYLTSGIQGYPHIHMWICIRTQPKGILGQEQAILALFPASISRTGECCSPSSSTSWTSHETHFLSYMSCREAGSKEAEPSRHRLQEHSRSDHVCEV